MRSLVPLVVAFGIVAAAVIKNEPDESSDGVIFQDEQDFAQRIDLSSLPRPRWCVEANVMVYTDDEGVQREIYLPKDTGPLAWDHLENERWDELAKYETHSESIMLLCVFHT